MNTEKVTLANLLKGKLAEKAAIAGETTFVGSRFFQMVLRGETKLPLDRVKEVAELLGCDSRDLFRLALKQFYTDDAVELFETMLADPITESELAWLGEIRSAANGNVKMPSAVARRLIRSLAAQQASA